MLGLMQDWPLTVDRIIDHAKNWHGSSEIVSRSVEGPIVRTTYADVHTRAKRLSNGLLSLGVRLGDRVATLAWNTGRHMEAWYGIMGIGAICHTLNPRLFQEQLAWIINHAEDRIIFADLTFAPILAATLHQCPSVEHVIFFAGEADMPAFEIEGGASPTFKGVICYETWVESFAAETAWGGFDENTACGLCYTSGTTGDPKGVLYSHRSNFIHALMGLQKDVFGISAQDVILPIVPMYHANAWGLAFHAPATGAKLVMPGAKLDGASVYELLETEQVTFSAAVPTVWQGLLQHLQATGAKLPHLTRVVVGGAACPESLIRTFHDDYGVDVIHAWGMTETSPLGTLGSLTRDIAALPFDQQVPWRMKQGRPPITVEMKLTDDEGERLPQDGHAFGRLKVAGPAIVKAYFKGAGGDVLDDEGFFDTGDVATIDPDGYMQITDRAKDVIKSGGEWISSIELENLAVGHPKAALAAVIGVPHPKWDERPLLLVKLKEGEAATRDEFLAHLDGKIAKWWTPDDVVFVDDIPLGATGKIDKKVLRKSWGDYVLPELRPATAPAAAPLLATPDPVLYAPEPENLDDEDPDAPLTLADGENDDEPVLELSATDGAEASEPVTEVEPVALADLEPALEAAAVDEAVEAEVAASEPEPATAETAAIEAEPVDVGATEAENIDAVPVEAAPEAAAPASEAPLTLAAPSQPIEVQAPKEPALITRLGVWARRYFAIALVVSLIPAVLALVGVAAVVVGAWSWDAGAGRALVQGAVGQLGLVSAAWQAALFLSVVALVIAGVLNFRRYGWRAAIPLIVTLVTLAGFNAARNGAFPSVVAADLGQAVVTQLASAFGV